jgi:hypothetical protein
MLLSAPADQSPFTPEWFRDWLALHRLDPLLDTLLAADARDVGAVAETSSIVMPDILRLHAALVEHAPGQVAAASMVSRELADDLAYVLSRLRTSHSLLLLTAFNTCFPGFSDRLLGRVAMSTPGRAHVTLLVQRVRHLTRHYCLRESLSTDRRAEVIAAIEAAAMGDAEVFL